MAVILHVYVGGLILKKYYYFSKSAGINVQSPQSATTPRTLTLGPAGAERAINIRDCRKLSRQQGRKIFCFQKCIQLLLAPTLLSLKYVHHNNLHFTTLVFHKIEP